MYTKLLKVATLLQNLNAKHISLYLFANAVDFLHKFFVTIRSGHFLDKFILQNLRCALLSNRCSNVSNFNYKPQVESRQQYLALYMERHLCSVAIMIEVTSRHTECTHYNSNNSQMPAVALQW